MGFIVTQSDLVLTLMMDHLPRPQMSMHTSLEIPFLLDERHIYDGLGLSEFPERMGFYEEGMI